MLSKLGPHIQATGPLGEAWTKRAGIVKVVDNVDLLRLAPDNAIRVFRHYWADQDIDPERAADESALALGDYRHPLLYVEGVNETKREPAWWQRFTRRIQHYRVRAAICSWATGDYELSDWKAFRAVGWCGADAIALHAYWANYGFTIWNAVRWRQYWELGDPPIIVTECGRDRVRDAPNGLYDGSGGWVTDQIGPERYLAELIDYESELQRNSYVLGATVFTLGGGDRWRDYGLEPLDDALVQQFHVKAMESQSEEAIAMNPYIEWIRAGGDGTLAGYIEHRAHFGDSAEKASADVLHALLAPKT